MSFRPLMLALVLTGCQHQPPAYVSRVDNGRRPIPLIPKWGLSGLRSNVRFPSAEGDGLARGVEILRWESVIQGAPAWPPEVEGCGSPSTTPGDDCTWGSPDAPAELFSLGTPSGLSYANPLRFGCRELRRPCSAAHRDSLPGCQFADDLIDNPDEGVMDVCPARKQHAVDYINNAKPQ